ncbi:MAG: protein translocase subunit SecF [Chitinispirillales bacterium]|jgi:preprotein translocase subunit SecF|nr:protein translocase subunit SecF [Chitinispirillales bacterium]
MLQIFKNTKYDFLCHSKKAQVVVIGFMVVSLVMLVINGGFNMSIDFVGGTTMHMKFEQPVRDDLTAIRSSVGALDFGQPEIKSIGLADNNELQITVRSQPEGVDVVGAVRGALAGSLPGNDFEMLAIEHVGPKIGSELTRDAIIASILALMAILLYIGLRFKLSYAVASVIPLGVNVLIMLGVFAIFELELTLPFLAAVLTVIGYALNDSIVVFDRVRENLKSGLRGGKKFYDVINASINQTLARTIVTSVTTLFTVGALYILGSDSIKNFALVMGLGIIIGTLSTIYIAAPLLVRWHNKWPIVK